MTEQQATFTVTVSGAPTAQYAKGPMLVARGDTRDEIVQALADVFDDEGIASAYVDTFKVEAERSIKLAVEGVLAKPDLPDPGRTETAPRKPWKKPSTPKPSAAPIGLASDKQLKAVYAISKGIGMDDDDLLEFANEQVGELNAISNITRGQASKLIDSLRSVQAEAEGS